MASRLGYEDTLNRAGGTESSPLAAKCPEGQIYSDKEGKCVSATDHSLYGKGGYVPEKDPTDQNLYGQGGYVPEGEGTDENLYGKGGYIPQGTKAAKRKKKQIK